MTNSFCSVVTSRRLFFYCGETNHIYWTCVYIYSACKLCFESFFKMSLVFPPRLVRKLQGSSSVCLSVVFVFRHSFNQSTLDISLKIDLQAGTVWARSGGVRPQFGSTRFYFAFRHQVQTRALWVQEWITSETHNVVRGLIGPGLHGSPSIRTVPSPCVFSGFRNVPVRLT